MAQIKLNIVSNVGANNYEIIEFKGEMDKSNIAQIRAGLDEYLLNYAKDFLILDLKDLDFINSEGVGYLVADYYRLLKKAKKMCIAGTKQQVMDVFNLVGLPKLIPCYPTVGECVTALSQTP